MAFMLFLNSATLLWSIKKKPMILTEVRSDKEEMTVKVPELQHGYRGLGNMDQSHNKMHSFLYKKV